LNEYLSVLEYDKVLLILGGYIRTFQGKRELDKIEISTDAAAIRGILGLTREVRDFTRDFGGLHFDETADIESSLTDSAKSGFVLGAEEVFEIKHTLEIFISNYDSVKAEAERYPLLWGSIVHAVIPHTLLRRFNHIFDSDGTIADRASPELARIHARKKTIRGQIHGVLQRTLESDTVKEGVQERIITVRDGRYVIPLRTSFKNRIKCIVHSFSKSGETAFVEPDTVIALNNEMMGIDEEEASEIRRILRELTAEIGESAEDLTEIDRLLGVLELLSAKARFAIEYRCGFPVIVPEKRIVLRRAFHPLLIKNNDLVPIDIEVGSKFQGLVISGPNAGGKTVALKTVGLLTLMALSGIPVTASDDSEIGIFDKVMAEIGDEQSITRNLSTFSGHIVSLSKIIRSCDNGSLVLIDEITSATEPKEGEALGQEIIRTILDKGARFIVTTHYQGIKEIGFSDTRVCNAFVEFDDKNLKPLFHLFVGGTGNSFALKIAQRYGIEPDIIQRAEVFLKEHFSESEKLIRNIEHERNEVARQNEELRRKLTEVEYLKNEQSRIIETLRKEKESLEKKGIASLKSELDDTLKQLASLKGSLKKTRPDDPGVREQIKIAEQTATEAKEFLDRAESEILKREKTPVSELKPGMTVYVRSFDKEGIVEDVSGDKVKIRIGLISVTSGFDDLFLSEKERPDSGKGSLSRDLPRLNLILDVRGERADEALRLIEKNIDVAWVQGVKEFEIIHGKGEGILRKAIWDFLKTFDIVDSYRFAKPDEGGQGKTIVSLKGD